MPKFIELHISSTEIPININVDTIAYFMEMRGIVYVYLTVPIISSSESSGHISKVEGKAKYFTVTESYRKVKSLIED